MANNYLMFSEMIQTESEEQAAWIAQKMAEHIDDDGDRYPPCLYEVESKNVWVHADEYGDVGALADIVCEWQQTFGIEEPWSLQYSNTCSKPRIDEFSGGAVVCYKGQAHFMQAGSWVTDKIEELANAK